MTDFILAPSILSADFAHMGDELEKIAKGGAQYVHLDVMDGRFVPNISFGIPVIASLKKDALRRELELVFDAHLMIHDHECYVKDFIEAGSDIVTFHYETCKTDSDVLRTVDLIRRRGAKAGLAINPSTPVDVLIKFASEIDMALIMSVNPGFGGQGFIESALDKARTLRKHAPTLDIQMDGGINLANYKTVLEAGANIIVVGSAIFNQADVINETKKYSSHI